MKKIYFSTLLSLAILFVYQEMAAQSTLTNLNTSPQVGDSFIIHSIDTTDAEGSAGANITWDFSGLSSLGTSTLTWISPSTTPYASSFPNSNICFESGGYYDYYSSSSSEYSRQGMVNSSGTTIAYSDPQIHISYPCSFNTTFTDYFASTYNNTGYVFYRTGNITVTADAYGTLILPYDTINDVIRLKMVEDYQDSADIGGPYLIYYNTEAYVWYKPGIHYAIMSLTSFTSSQSGTVEYGGYMDQASTGIHEAFLSKYDFNIYPNPATLFTNINYTIKDQSDVKITLHNPLGQEMGIILNEEQLPGSYMETFNTEGLDKGVYFITLKINKALKTKIISIK